MVNSSGSVTWSRIASAWWVLHRLRRPRHPRLDNADKATALPTSPTQTMDSNTVSPSLRDLSAVALATETIEMLSSLFVLSRTCEPLLGNKSSGSQSTVVVSFDINELMTWNSKQLTYTNNTSLVEDVASKICLFILSSWTILQLMLTLTDVLNISMLTSARGIVTATLTKIWTENDSHIFVPSDLDLWH